MKSKVWLGLKILCLSSGLLKAQVPQTLLRGPYLQQVSPNSAIVKWRTMLPANSVVKYGTDSTQLSQMVESTTVLNDHSVKLIDLKPNTKYYYSISSNLGPIQGNGRNFFITHPPIGTAAKTLIWAIGDAGMGNATHKAVRDAFFKFNNNQDPNLWLMLGDNAYYSGQDAEYQTGLFDIYPDFAKHNACFPTFGNHDSYGSLPTPGNETGPFFNVFDLPSAGEYSTLASNTETYYSYNYANMHFVSLDGNASQQILRNTAMLEWLMKDLESNKQTWTIVYFHHPAYTKGSHDSDDSTAEFELFHVREVIVPILEQYGVDLVLNGHSHSYERSKFINGHYGKSETFNDSMIVQSGNGRKDGDGPYLKRKGAHKGIVYVVAGSSCQTGGGDLNHPAMYKSLDKAGSFLIQVEGDELTGAFLSDSSAILDYFSIKKDNSSPTTGIDEFVGLGAELYPNPAQNQCNLKLNYPETGLLEVQITNLNGQQLLSKSVYHTAGSFNHVIDVNSLPVGVYHLKVLAMNKTVVANKKLAIIK